MPTKMQDQLVLMEEVFANSNFTNNVKGGVIAEVIGLVNEIDEQWVLKTDLLGDAIESALSETGGTKDLGLYRTPDHIRKMMVEMVDPDFTDIIFDPACGTSGFLFNAYEYVIEKARKTRRFPPEHIANQFYRAGIGGIEYQGRIRKMAAVNMYIRGLNPHNIVQGDSLKMYDPSSDVGSKSVVIANPPFGAERDQPAYPNVWEDYSKESETTILFVKLMFDLLRQGGRCAVVVSEGFLTWGQNSACALRKLLLNEANLRAVISLPQGVFVSKGGQGAKTSILYFEKGSSTDPGLQPAGTRFVWYYKIENDGFSMGTNRKPIEGSQIPQLLEIFKEIKQGKRPKDTRHSFCIPKAWIETLDPRLAERIKKEVNERFTEKNKAKRERLLAGLDEKLAKGKLSKAMYDEKLWQFDNVVESQVDNEIAKAIEKANSYHFNLQNYRSNLSEEQIKEWKSVCHSFTISHSKQIPHPEQISHSDQAAHSEQLPHCHSERSEESQGLSIEKRYQELKTADPKTALKILASFDPQNALQMDIAKEYLHKQPEETLKSNELLNALNTILKSDHQYPKQELGRLLTLQNGFVEIEDDQEYKLVTCKLHGQGIVFRESIFGRDIKTKKQQIVKANQLLVAEIDAKNGGYGIIPSECDGAIVSSHYYIYSINQSELLPAYLSVVLTSKVIEDQVRTYVRGTTSYAAIRSTDFLNIKIPLPPLEVQNEIVEKIESQKTLIEAAKRIEESWEVTFDIFKDFQTMHISDFAELNPVRDYLELDDGTLVSFIPMDAIDEISGKIKNYVTKPLKDVKKGYTFFAENDVLFAKITPCMENGKIVIAKNLCNGIGFGTTELHVLRAKSNKVLPRYIFYLLRTKYFRDRARESMTGASGHKRVPEKFLMEFPYPLAPLPVQQEIVAKLDREMEALEGVRLLRQAAERRIEMIISDVWGEG
ncbi:N-6 DNA methylase [Candidatus Brocadia pituitae]|nr:N-6 DNA methylase [Candidatus Brocadia pituitae]